LRRPTGPPPRRLTYAAKTDGAASSAEPGDLENP
jgi:hypothetical protein